MTVSAVTQANATAGATQLASASNLVDYNSFLKLLVAQAKNQDPTNPQDSGQYLSQLASFSAVEQGVQTNARLEAMLSRSRIADADALVGRTVVSADGAQSGVVAFVTLQGADILATLTSGSTMLIGDGVSIGPAR